MGTPVWVVKEVIPKKDYTLHITFADGSEKVYNARPLLDKPVYVKLRSTAFFLKAKACCGSVVWNDDIDIAPEHLYECSVAVSDEAKNERE